MTSVATILMISVKLYQPEKSQPKQRKWFFFSSVAVGLFLEWANVHQEAKLVAALLRVAGVSAGLAESNGSLPPGL